MAHHFKRERILREIDAAKVRKFEYNPQVWFRKKPRGTNVRFADAQTVAILAKITCMKVREFERHYTK